MHNIECFTYPEKTDRKKIIADINDFVERHSDSGSGLYNPIRFVDGPIYESYEEAENAIKGMDKGWYDSIAVRFKHPLPLGDDKKKDALQKAADEAFREYRERDEKVYPKTLTSEFLGCKNCGSKLRIKHLSSNICPVCREDLRPEYIRNSVAAAKARYVRACTKVKEYVSKHAKKEIVWLVKFEYHT